MTPQFILSCIYFFLPAYFTNMTPPLLKRTGLFNFLAKPVDFGKKIGQNPILGGHKSWRGVIFGLIAGILIAGLQYWFYQFPFIQKISLVDYRQINVLFFGFLISTGAIFGDLLFAFIKRRLKMAPGARFLPFDLTNYVIGAFIFLEPFLKLSYFIWLTIFVLTFFLHRIVNHMGYWMGLHRNKW